ncbi:cell envelope biogenesis protein OmpA [Streptomyces griseoluteus]|uniref:cell envelope biogenesis protein OmpA n=1 Tax=Streptomyces griseoluteus TaxID=29306 RepID=UPI003812F66C
MADRRPRKPRPPARAKSRPRHGGLVVPWVTGWNGDRPAFGILFPLRRITAVTQRRCQLCGQQLGRRIGLVVRPRDIEAGYSSEPGMHPECLDYATTACPMLNGSLDSYRQQPPSAVAHLVTSASPRQGLAAEAYDAWYITPSGYEVAYDPGGEVLGISLDVPVLMKKPVRTAAAPRLTGKDAELLRAVLDLALEGPDA